MMGIGTLVSVVSLVLSAIGALISGAMFIAIKFNDVKHIQLAVEEIQKSVKAIEESDKNRDIAIAEIVARCSERHIKTVRVIKKRK
jgi:uncharacterized protein (UPF0264 family)